MTKPALKNKILSDEDVERICKIVGCDKGDVKSAKKWCFFPADHDLSPLIHYEFINGYVEFHIECESGELKEMFKNESNLDIKNDDRRYRLKDSTINGSCIFCMFDELKKISQPIIDKYKNNLKNKYTNAIRNYEKATKESLYPKYSNFFDLLSNSRADGKEGRLSENDHTRVLLAILKAGGDGLPVLRSFIQQIGITCNFNGTQRKDIVFNKRYDDSDGANFIDGLIYQKESYAIIIENKIEGAGDQPKQIERYIKAINTCEGVELDHIWVIYLTKDGALHENGRPTEVSYQDNSNDNKDCYIGDRLLCINYHDDIQPWLKEYALPLTKYTDASIGWMTDSYVDYLEHMFKEDVASRKKTEQEKRAVFNNLNIAGKPIDEQYKELSKAVSELSTLTLYDGYVEVLRNYKREIEKHLYGVFEKETIAYFKGKGHDVIVINKINGGFIQIRGVNWNPLVHFEWYPITAQSLFNGTTPISLCVHLEGDFKDKTLRRRISCDVNECLAKKIVKDEIRDWLNKQYDQIIDTWEILEQIAAKKDFNNNE